MEKYLIVFYFITQAIDVMLAFFLAADYPFFKDNENVFYREEFNNWRFKTADIIWMFMIALIPGAKTATLVNEQVYAGFFKNVKERLKKIREYDGG